MQQNRRQFIKTSLGLAAAAPWLATYASTEPGHKAVAGTAPTGLQLYTLRDMMEKSVAQTLQLVAGIGYRELEFAGYFGHSASAIRKLLDQHQLRSPAVHVPLEQLRGALPQVIDDALVIGHQYLVLPWLSEAQRGNDISNYQRLAKELNQFAEQAKAAGLQLAYHNHDFELLPVKGGIPYDVLLAETDPQLVKMELDLFWAVKAGVDPLALFKAHPGRFPCLHIKDMASDGSMTDVGSGTIDFASLLAGARRDGGSQHFFIEHDNSSNRIQTITRGWQTLTQLLNR